MENLQLLTSETHTAFNDIFTRALDETKATEFEYLNYKEHNMEFSEKLTSNLVKYGYNKDLISFDLEPTEVANVICMKINKELAANLGYRLEDDVKGWAIEVPEKPIPLDPIKYPVQKEFVAKEEKHDDISAPATVFTIPENPTEVHPVDMTHTVSHVEIDPNTGANKVVSNEYVTKGQADVGISDIDINPGFEINDDGQKFLEEQFEPEEMIEVLEFIKAYKKGMKSTWTKMPKCLKNKMVQGLPSISTNVAQMNFAANAFMDMFIGEIDLEQEFVDIETALQKEFANLGDGTAELTSQFSKEKFESLLELAEKDKDKDPEKYDTINKMYLIYKDATTFATLKSIARDCKLGRGGKFQRLDKFFKRYEKECDNFNYKYKTNTIHNFGITNVKAMGLALKRSLSGDKYTEDDIMKFVLLFIRYTLNYSAEDKFDHIFMYYTIKTVCLLDALSKDNEMFKEIISNVEEVIDLLK